MLLLIALYKKHGGNVMSERKFAVIGHPIGHTMSPFIHKRLFELSGERGIYTILDVAPEEFPEKISTLNELAGYNVTIPNKQVIIPFLDELDKKAELYGSVNTVRNGAVRKGFTTDPDGFLKALEANNIPFVGNVCIIGCGGVARTFIYEAALAGCNITICVRPEDVEIRDGLAKEVKEKIGISDIHTCLISDIEREGNFDILINATPVGMYPKTDAMPVSEEVIIRCKYIFDAVYNPLETRLIQASRANGLKAVGGMAMLVWQAVVSHEIWDGSQYNTDDINQLIEDSSKELKKNF